MNNQIKELLNILGDMADAPLRHRVSIQIRRPENNEQITHPMTLRARSWKPSSPRRGGVTDEIIEGESVDFCCHDMDSTWISIVKNFIADMASIKCGKELAFLLLVSESPKDVPKLGVVAVELM
jgi:hypothetical protein